MSTSAPRAYSPDQVRQIRNALPPGFLDQVIGEEIEKRKPPTPPPPRERTWPTDEEGGRWKAISSGMHKRMARPQASADDRTYVPGALKHWRRVHGLTQRQAQEKLGYSAKSCSWQHWEAGFAAPPYRTLLKIILATGLGYWTDPDHSASVDPDLRLEMARGRASMGARSR